MTYTIEPIAHVRGGRAMPDDDDWGGVTATIELAPGYSPETLAGLAEFSHVEIVFLFDRVAEGAIERGARRPRGGETGRWSGSSRSAARTGPTASA